MKYPYFGPYLTLTGGGTYYGEVDYEMTGTNSDIFAVVQFDFARSRGVEIGRNGFIGGSGTWRSPILDVGESTQDIELRVRRIEFSSTGCQSGSFDLNIKELRIIQHQ